MTLATGMLAVVLPAVLLAVLLVPALRAALPRVLRQPAFLAAAVVLGVAAVGLNAATEAMRLHFRKLPVPLAVPRLDDPKLGIPARVGGHWVQVSKDEPLDPATQEALGTKEFVFRDYVDARVVPEADLAWFADKSTEERARRVAEIQLRSPEAVVRLAITYYTGLVDTVPHVPERCYVADGFEPATPPETRTRVLGTTAAGAPREVGYRYLRFQDTTGHGRVDRQVAYLFHVNGRYASDASEVRLELQNLFRRHGYFAKVEVMTTARAARPGAPAAAAGTAGADSAPAFENLLAAVLPELERCLPDWQKVLAMKPE